MNTLTVTVLIENEASDKTLCCEHGLSLYLRFGSRRILLDAGQSGTFTENAAALGCPLDALDAVVLSHGHYDHADGLPALLERNRDARVYARPAVMMPQYSGERYIGLCSELTGPFADRFDLSDELREILPGAWLVPDGVEHEQSLVLETGQGLVVLNSCCHAGADHIVADILSRFPGQKVRALIGGLHLMGPGGVATLGREADEVRALARRLTAELGVEEICIGHCTGAPACALLREAVPGRFRTIHTGDILSF